MIQSLLFFFKTVFLKLYLKVYLYEISPVWQHTFVSPSAFSRRAVVSYWRKYVHEVLVNRLGGLSLPRKSVVRLTDRPDMTLDVYRGRKTTIQPTTMKSRLTLEVGYLDKSYVLLRTL